MKQAQTRAELIDPALKAADWRVIEGSRICREVIAPGGKQQGVLDFVLEQYIKAGVGAILLG